MKDLETIRKEWENGLEAKSVLEFEYKTVVILEENNSYYIHRYFLMGGDWVCSIDQSGLSLDDVFEHLEYIIK